MNKGTVRIESKSDVELYRQASASGVQAATLIIREGITQLKDLYHD